MLKSRIQKMREENGEGGFTLIELLVVVVIIGVLVAIAIPLYLNYRKGAENKSAMSDIRNSVVAVEQYYTENSNAYPASILTNTSGTNLTFTGTTPEQANVSTGNVLVFKNNTTSYVICGANTDGSTIYVYNSANGGSVTKATVSAYSTANLTTCLTNGS